jgi:hypothetical protein
MPSVIMNEILTKHIKNADVNVGPYKIFGDDQICHDAYNLVTDCIVGFENHGFVMFNWKFYSNSDVKRRRADLNYFGQYAIIEVARMQYDDYTKRVLCYDRNLDAFVVLEFPESRHVALDILTNHENISKYVSDDRNAKYRFEEFCAYLIHGSLIAVTHCVQMDVEDIASNIDHDMSKLAIEK